MAGKRVQASVEALLVIAALFAFLLAFIPAINNVRELVRFAIASKSAEVAVQEIYDAVREVTVLGNGNVITRKISFLTDAQFSYEEAASELRLRISVGGRTKNFSKETLLPIEFKKNNLTKGEYFARVSNNGRVLGVEFNGLQK